VIAHELFLGKYRLRMRIDRGSPGSISSGRGLSADLDLADADYPRMHISDIRTPLIPMV
jgi:hypothetical protein